MTSAGVARRHAFSARAIVGASNLERETLKWSPLTQPLLLMKSAGQWTTLPGRDLGNDVLAAAEAVDRAEAYY